MAKTKDSGAGTGGKKSKAREILDALSEAGKARVKAMQGKGLVWLLFALACGIAALFDWHAAPGVSLGLLYLMPDGEAKSGRTGSVVYMRNGRRRNFVVPALVQNTYTMPVRASFGGISNSFRALTPSQQAGWNSATGFFQSDRFGRSKEVRGKALYVMLNQNLFNIGAALITDVPVAQAVQPITGGSLSAAVTGNLFDVSFDPNPIDANVAAIVFATAQLSPGVNKPGKSEFRMISLLSPGATSPADLFAAYTTKFGPLVAGGRVFVKFRVINNTTGQSADSIVISDDISA